MMVGGVELKTVWYCLKVYSGKIQRYIAQEYADHNLKWMEASLVCGSEKECFDKCNVLNKEIITKEQQEESK